MPGVIDCFERLLVALLVGLLIGVDRERAEERKARQLFAGIRTFPLIALAGALPALMLPATGPALLVVSLAAVAVLVAAAYLRESLAGQPGATTEVAAIVTFLLGALAGTGQMLLAGATGIAVATLLVAKPGLENFSKALTPKELASAIQLAILTGIVLPLAPNQGYGPWSVLNPYEIWMVVVLVSGFSFAGFLAMRLFGRERGMLLSGVMGALVSSTAVTVAMAGRSRDDETAGVSAARATVLASVVMGLRVGAFAAAMGAGLLPRLVPVIVAMSLVGLLAERVLHRLEPGDNIAMDGNSPGNPFSLPAALSFGALYAVVLLALKAAHEYLGAAGVFVAAGLSSVADVDAVTIAFARGGPGADDWRTAAAAVTVAIVINTLVKMSFAVGMGAGAFRRHVATALAAMAVAGVAAGAAVWFVMA
jgi:uncharacterized membrane protein (DUF4010 family)